MWVCLWACVRTGVCECVMFRCVGESMSLLQLICPRVRLSLRVSVRYQIQNSLSCPVLRSKVSQSLISQVA